MSLSKEKNFPDSRVSVFRRGCGISKPKVITGGGATSGTGILLAPSPVTIRAKWTTSVWWDITQGISIGNAMRWTDNLAFDFVPPTGMAKYDQQLSAGLNQYCVVQALGSRPYVGQMVRLGTNIFPTAGWKENHANYTLKGKILFEMPVSLVQNYNIWCKWNWVGDVWVWETGSQTDNPKDFTGIYNLTEMSQTAYTTYKIITTKIATGYNFTVTNSYNNIVFFRRSKDATDTTWFNLGITW